MKLTSADVMHSFWVPRLAGKTDLLPNRVNEMWIDPQQTGLYVGQCAQFCGMEHAKMLLRVYVDSPEQFQQWITNQQTTPSQVAAFAVYREEIARWSAQANLTALRLPEEIVQAGFLDSLACLPLIPSAAMRAIDVGSGAGFPGLPVKLVRTDISLTLVEASRKKATFLRHVVRQLGLAKVRVVRGRAEELATDSVEACAYDLALARAVVPPLDQAALVRPFLCSGGLFLLQVGPRALLPDLLEKIAALGFEAVRGLTLPLCIGRPGRRVLALRRIG
jgi:16S rRNA (guanine(527)-N(7))-methyltransferase RsmG